MGESVGENAGKWLDQTEETILRHTGWTNDLSGKSLSLAPKL